MNEPDAGTGAARVGFGCVAENDARHRTETLLLLKSLRWFGGRLADSRFVVCAAEEMDAEYANLFESLGASVQIVEREHPEHVWSNKLRFLDARDLDECDIAVFLDCDTLVVRDPSPWLDGERFQACMARVALDRDAFERLFNHFGLPVPPQDSASHPGGQRRIRYVQAGVLVFPQALRRRLGASWREWNRRLLDMPDAPNRFTDQAALAVAMATDPAPFAELPLGMNCPVKAKPPKGDHEGLVPVILHHHHRLNRDGTLRRSALAPVQEAVERFNERARREIPSLLDGRVLQDLREAFPSIPKP